MSSTFERLEGVLRASTSPPLRLNSNPPCQTLSSMKAAHGGVVSFVRLHLQLQTMNGNCTPTSNDMN